MSKSNLHRMRVSVPATLLISLSAHNYLSHALPLVLRPRSVAPRAFDYPVVSVVDPEVEAPDSASGDDEDDDAVTHTVTRASDAPTGTLTAGSTSPTEDCTTGTVVSVVGVKETGAVRTTTTYTGRSSSGTPTAAPTPSSPSPGAARTTGSASGASVSEPTAPPNPSSVSSVSVPADSRNGTSPTPTPSLVITYPSEEPSSSETEGAWPLPGFIIATDDPEPKFEPQPTPSSATWSTAPTPLPSGIDYSGDEYGAVDYDEEDYDKESYDEEDYDDEDYEEEDDDDEGQYAEDEYAEDESGGAGEGIPTAVSTIPAPLSTSTSGKSYDGSNLSGYTSWNGTIAS